MKFSELKLTPSLYKSLQELGFEDATPIQAEAFGSIAGGKDVVGIAQTGTGKTLAYLLPILRNFKYSTQENPRTLILVPTRELVVQVVNEAQKFADNMSIRVLGVYGGTNINTQKKELAEGQDIIVGTPGRLYDLAVSKNLNLKDIKQVVIDEVDVMLDLGFRYQIRNIFDLLPPRRQHIMFSATMTEEVDVLINSYFVSPVKVSIAVTGTPLENIQQTKYSVPNYHTKVNLLETLLADKNEFNKVLVFVAYKKIADRLFESLQESFPRECAVIHSNKTQNYRLRSIEDLQSGDIRILLATDIMARGLDIDDISYVINFDTPIYPENYMHRIGRTGRAKKEGNAIIFYTEAESEYIENIEALMDMSIEKKDLPEEVEISKKLAPEEQPKVKEHYNPLKYTDENAPGPAFHRKKEKNRKENQGGKYRRELAKKYKKPKTRG
ncbi:MAG: DEAD/DEAH box helicase, partial [Flavobacteriaceae bacterium]|nr:DEAD/DEAH box helicase [Flavobacteriaceae bacterium]